MTETSEVVTHQVLAMGTTAELMIVGGDGRGVGRMGGRPARGARAELEPVPARQRAARPRMSRRAGGSVARPHRRGRACAVALVRDRRSLRPDGSPRARGDRLRPNLPRSRAGGSGARCGDRARRGVATACTSIASAARSRCRRMSRSISVVWARASPPTSSRRVSSSAARPARVSASAAMFASPVSRRSAEPGRSASKTRSTNRARCARGPSATPRSLRARRASGAGRAAGDRCTTSSTRPRARPADARRRRRRGAGRRGLVGRRCREGRARRGRRSRPRAPRTPRRRGGRRRRRRCAITARRQWEARVIAAIDPRVWWWVTRASGIVAWVVVAAAVVWGLLASTKLIRKRGRAGVDPRPAPLSRHAHDRVRRSSTSARSGSTRSSGSRRSSSSCRSRRPGGRTRSRGASSRPTSCSRSRSRRGRCDGSRASCGIACTC